MYKIFLFARILIFWLSGHLWAQLSPKTSDHMEIF